MQLVVGLPLSIAKALKNVVQLRFVRTELSTGLLASFWRGTLGHVLPRLTRFSVQRQRVVLLVQQRLHEAVFLLQFLLAAATGGQVIAVFAQSGQEVPELVGGREVLAVRCKAVLALLLGLLQQILAKVRRGPSSLGIFNLSSS